MSSNPESWLRKALREIPILVLGILIAFALQAWWDNSLTRADEQRMLLALRAELQLNEEGLVTYIRRHDRVAEAVMAFQAPLAGSRTVQIPDSLLVAALVSPTFDPATGALESLLRAGVGQSELSAAVTRWRSVADDAREEERRSRAFTDDRLGPFLGRTIDLPAADLAIPWIYERLVTPIEGNTAVTPSPELRFLLSTRLKLARLSSLELTEALDETRATLAILEREIR